MSTLRIALLHDAGPPARIDATVVALERACRALRMTALRVEAREHAPDATLAELVALEVDVVIPLVADSRRASAIRWLLDWAHVPCVGSDARAVTIAREPAAVRGVLADRGVRIHPLEASASPRFEAAFVGSGPNTTVFEPCGVRTAGPVERDPHAGRVHADALRGFVQTTCTALGLGGYGCIEFALDAGGSPCFVRVDPEPDLAPDAKFASAAARAHVEYASLVRRIVEDALAIEPRKRTRP